METVGGTNQPRLMPEMWETAKLAAPIVVARAGLVVLITVNTMMIGRYAAEELAVYGLGITSQNILMLAGIGMSQGVMILVSQTMGAGDKGAVGGIWRAGVVQAILLGLLFLAISALTAPVLQMFDVETDVAAAAGRVSILFGIGLVPMLIYVVTGYVLESAGHVRIGMLITTVANIVNGGLAYLLVFGTEWIPAMGAGGAVIALTAARFTMMIMAVAYLLRLPEREELGLGSWRGLIPTGLNRKVARLGLPLGLSQALDVGAYRSLAIIAFAISPLAMAAWEVFNNLIALVYMTAIATSAATSIRVGRAVGRGDASAVRMAGLAGGAVVTLIVCALVWTWALIPEAVGGLYVDEGEALALISQILPIGAIVILVDCLLNVFMGGCRGAGDTWRPAQINIACLWLVAVPLAIVLYNLTTIGLPSLAIGLAVGLAVGAVAMVQRFLSVAARPIARV
ncbi:MAG: MATE family efflux transporter [Alphaproteobacteria bacterium]